VGPPFTKSLSWGSHNSNFTMVYCTQITSYNYSFHGVYKPTKPTFTSLGPHIVKTMAQNAPNRLPLNAGLPLAPRFSAQFGQRWWKNTDFFDG